MFFPEKNDNSEPISDLHNIHLCSCFRSPLTCLHPNLIHLMGSGLLNLEWIRVNLTSNAPFDYGQMYISAARTEYHLFYCTRCLTTWKVVKRIFWTRASGRVLLSILSRSRPSLPFSSAAWRYSFRSWTRWRSIFRNLFFSGKPNDVIVGGERHRRGNWESKLPRQADDRWNLRGGFFFSTKLELDCRWWGSWRSPPRRTTRAKSSTGWTDSTLQTWLSTRGAIGRSKK